MQALERSTSDTTAAFTSRSLSRAVYFRLVSLATKTCRAAIEKWACLQALGPFWPVPVWLCAIVVALVSQRLFKRSHIVAVPGEEVSSAVDEWRLLHVDNDEVVIAGFGARVVDRIQLGWLLHEAFYSRNVAEFGSSGQVTPWYRVSIAKKGEM